MATAQPVLRSASADRYLATRRLTERLAAALVPEDQVVQTMPDVSPTKWHRAHVTWFFEHFVLKPNVPGYRPQRPEWHYLFNSYYYSVGQMHARPERGLLSRPTAAEIGAWREQVDAAMVTLLQRRGDDAELAFLVELGINHEQQHQELLLADIKHVFAMNPLGPAYDDALPAPATPAGPGEGRWLTHPGGDVTIGADPRDGFCFDNETPRHEVQVSAYQLAPVPVSNEAFRAFIDAGGYREPSLWLADGWTIVCEQGWTRPLYWSEDLEREFTLGGWRPIDPHAPVCHVSFYEADAFARWAGARLPSEAEHEALAKTRPVDGNLLDSGLLQPAATATTDGVSLYGDVWEWTASPYLAYPGFTPLAGSLGEYNGKFMWNQVSVRGGSCLTPTDHLRASYRSFFYPHQRWQCLGFRLARDA